MTKKSFFLSPLYYAIALIATLIFCSILIIPFNQVEQHFESPFHPKDFIKISRSFGKGHRSALSKGLVGVRLVDNKGITYEVRDGAPVLSIEKGIVKKCNNSTSLGNYILIDYGNDLVAKYYHLKEITVQQGQMVTKGEQIGISGDLGLTILNSIGLEIRKKGAFINPNSILRQE